MVAGEGTDTHRQIKTIRHSKIIMATTEEEGECHPEEAVGEDRCKGHQQQMDLEEDTIKEVVDKAEDILRTVVLWAGEEDQLH
jgi:hypothetical protein